MLHIDVITKFHLFFCQRRPFANIEYIPIHNSFVPFKHPLLSQVGIWRSIHSHHPSNSPIHYFRGELASHPTLQSRVDGGMQVRLNCQSLLYSRGEIGMRVSICHWSLLYSSLEEGLTHEFDSQVPEILSFSILGSNSHIMWVFSNWGASSSPWKNQNHVNVAFH